MSTIGVQDLSESSSQFTFIMEQYEDIPSNRQTKGIWIPIDVWESKDLTWNEKILFLEIDSFTSKDKDCFFSNEYIAKLLSCTETSASRILSSLIKKGYVIKTRFDGRRRFVRTAYSYNKDLDLSQKTRQGCHKRQGRLTIKDNIINTINKESKDKEILKEKEPHKRRLRKDTKEGIKEMSISGALEKVKNEPFDKHPLKEKEKSCAKRERERFLGSYKDI